MIDGSHSLTETLEGDAYLYRGAIEHVEAWVPFLGSWVGRTGGKIPLACFSSLLEVGSLPDTRCMVPQLYAVVGNLSHSGVLGRIGQPTVPRVNYPDKNAKLILFCR
jgi:hypothetical protein